MGLHDKFPRYRLNPDLDFHDAPPASRLRRPIWPGRRRSCRLTGGKGRTKQSGASGGTPRAKRQPVRRERNVSQYAEREATASPPRAKRQPVRRERNVSQYAASETSASTPRAKRQPVRRERNVSQYAASETSASTPRAKRQPVRRERNVSQYAASETSAGARPAADAAPGQPGHQLLRGVFRDHAFGAEPVRGTDVGHADQADAEQMRLVVAHPGVLPDDLADHLRTHPHGGVEPLPDRALVAQVRLEDQAKRLAGATHEVEERGEGGADPLLVVRRGRERGADGVGQRLHALIEQGEVELELAREMLVQHGLADASPLGDLVHRRGVVPLRDEDLLGRPKQLPAPGLPRQPRAGRPGLRGCGHETLRCVPSRGSAMSNPSYDRPGPTRHYRR